MKDYANRLTEIEKQNVELRERIARLEGRARGRGELGESIGRKLIRKVREARWFRRSEE